MSRLSNPDFLSTYLTSDPASQVPMAGRFLLPVELALIEQERKALARQTMADSAVERATRNWRSPIDGQTLSQRQRLENLGEYLAAAVVDYPDAEEPSATLGSRVTVEGPRGGYTFDIVGCVPVHGQIAAPGIRPASLDASLAQHIIGSHVGEAASMHLPGRTVELEITAIDQQAISQAHQALQL